MLIAEPTVFHGSAVATAVCALPPSWHDPLCVAVIAANLAIGMLVGPELLLLSLFIALITVYAMSFGFRRGDRSLKAKAPHFERQAPTSDRAIAERAL